MFVFVFCCDPLYTHASNKYTHTNEHNRKDPKILLDNPGADLRWKRIVEDSGASRASVLHDQKRKEARDGR